MRLQKYWYLGVLGVVGIYAFPDLTKVFSGEHSLWSLTNLAWFLWFLNFLPEDAPTESPKPQTEA